jgi:hypothetical protein
MATWRTVKAAIYSDGPTSINLDLVCWMGRVGDQTVVRFAGGAKDDRDSELWVQETPEQILGG